MTETISVDSEFHDDDTVPFLVDYAEEQFNV